MLTNRFSISTSSNFCTFCFFRGRRLRSSSTIRRTDVVRLISQQPSPYVQTSMSYEKSSCEWLPPPSLSWKHQEIFYGFSICLRAHRTRPPRTFFPINFARLVNLVQQCLHTVDVPIILGVIVNNSHGSIAILRSQILYYHLLLI